MAHKTTLEHIEKALTQSGGFISHAAKLLGITPSAVSQRVKNSKRLQQLCEELNEKYLDIAESKLIAAVKNGELPAIFFYLKCKGKKRGYIERELTVNTDISINQKKETKIDLSGKSQDELLAIYNDAVNGE